MHKIQIRLIDGDNKIHESKPFSIDERRDIAVAIFFSIQQSLENVIKLLADLEDCFLVLDDDEEEEGENVGHA